MVNVSSLGVEIHDGTIILVASTPEGVRKFALAPELAEYLGSKLRRASMIIEEQQKKTSVH